MLGFLHLVLVTLHGVFTICARQIELVTPNTIFSIAPVDNRLRYPAGRVREPAAA